MPEQLYVLPPQAESDGYAPAGIYRGYPAICGSLFAAHDPDAPPQGLLPLIRQASNITEALDLWMQSAQPPERISSVVLRFSQAPRHQ